MDRRMGYQGEELCVAGEEGQREGDLGSCRDDLVDAVVDGTEGLVGAEEDEVDVDDQGQLEPRCSGSSDSFYAYGIGGHDDHSDLQRLSLGLIDNRLCLVTSHQLSLLTEVVIGDCVEHERREWEGVDGDGHWLQGSNIRGGDSAGYLCHRRGGHDLDGVGRRIVSRVHSAHSLIQNRQNQCQHSDGDQCNTDDPAAPGAEHLARIHQNHHAVEAGVEEPDGRGDAREHVDDQNVLQPPARLEV